MAESESEQKFDAAVKVIRSLPKSGSFQPSHEMMLKFYGNYKQAVEGPCKEAKPSFWDVVRKAKWEAWSKLGNISKKDAMENYVNDLKQVIEEMPETGQAAQFIETLEPFYKAVYCNDENPPPVFNMFRTKLTNGKAQKMNGHIEMNGNRENGDIEPITSEDHSFSNGEVLNRSDASYLHNIDIDYPVTNHGHGSEEVNMSNNEEIHNEIDDHSKERESVETSGMLTIAKNAVDDSRGFNGHVNDDNAENQLNDDEKNDDDDDDDDDLFCDSLGPELLELQADKTELSNAGDASREESVLNNYYGNHHSSFSDVEIIEQFETRNELESSIPEDKTNHVRFNESSSSSGDQTISKKTVENNEMVQPNQLGCGGGGGDEKQLLRATSERKQVKRNVSQQSDKHARYGHHYRRRSQESDSDDSPTRSDHNSSSERDDVGIDRITGLLFEIHDNMKKILERLKRVESSLQQNQNSWFENYKPSKTVVFLILWPFVVNFLFKFLQRRYENTRKR